MSNNHIRDELPALNDIPPQASAEISQLAQGETQEGKKCRIFSGFGCLCLILGYYILAVFLIGYAGRIHWNREHVVEFLQLPLIWPLLVTGWTDSQTSKLLLVIMVYGLYFWFVKQIAFPKSRKMAVVSFLGLTFLVLISLGGCVVALGRAIH